MVLLLGLVVAAGVALHRFVVVPSRRSTRYAISEAFEPGEIVRNQPLTMFLGLESSGVRDQQVMGTLVLTANRLWFHKQGTPGAILDVATTAIEDVALVRRHLGNETGRPLLRVRIAGPNGHDSAAFHLPFPDEWRIAIDNVRGDQRGRG